VCGVERFSYEIKGPSIKINEHSLEASSLQWNHILPKWCLETTMEI
jgi:hypothetical protein